MGIAITLETESGNRLELIEDPQNVLHRVLPSVENGLFRWASSIDWYGDTTFNYIQAGFLREEWRQLIEGACVEDAALLRQVDQLLRRATEERHLYVKFYGD